MNKFIVVSGGSKGIGKEIIKKFASQGFDAATCARGEAELENLRDLIVKEYGTKLHYQTADLSKKKEVVAFSDFVLSLPYEIDVLVNNAGLFVPGSVRDEPEGNLEYMIQTNLYSAYYLSRALTPKMLAQKEGYIFNICSIASLAAYPNGGSYTISKFALLGLSKVLREELKPQGIRVSSILPGATLTASWEGVDIPEERFIKPEDIAEIVFSAYKLSKQAVIEEIIVRPQLGDL